MSEQLPKIKHAGRLGQAPSPDMYPKETRENLGVDMPRYVSKAERDYYSEANVKARRIRMTASLHPDAFPRHNM